MFISPYQHHAAEEATEEDCVKIAELLNRPVSFVDNDGYEHDIIAGSVVNEGEKLAWVEEVSKNDSGFVDVTFTLKGVINGKEIINWEVETYNPFFGCHVSWLKWYGDKVALLYEEKHCIIVAVLSEDSLPKMRSLGYSSRLLDDRLYYRPPEPGLLEVIELPSLQRQCPVPEKIVEEAEKNKQIIPLGSEKFNMEPFVSSFKKSYFASEFPQPETDLLIGSLLYPFWIPWPNTSNSYNTLESQRWNIPRWLPFYWFLSLKPKFRRRFIKFLKRFREIKVKIKISSEIFLAVEYFREQIGEILEVCQKGALPKDSYCCFWRDWSVESLKKELHLFPPGFRTVFEELLLANKSH